MKNHWKNRQKAWEVFHQWEATQKHNLTDEEVLAYLDELRNLVLAEGGIPSDFHDTVEQVRVLHKALKNVA